MRLIAVVLASVLVFVPAMRPVPAARVVRAAPAGVVRYSAPVAPLRVVHAFDPPATPYGPGHLGVDLASRSGQVVRAAADGVVSFAGSVAGRGLVVITHPDGIRTEYEPIRPTVARGAVVRRGATIGRISGTHGTCAPGGCLHWGARRGEQYLDPLELLQPLGPVRLLPWTPETTAARKLPQQPPGVIVPRLIEPAAKAPRGNALPRRQMRCVVG